MKIQRSNPDPTLAQLFDQEPSIDSEAEFKKLMIAEKIVQLLRAQKLSRKELARRMDVPPSRITSMLDGSNNLTIKTLVRIGRALGHDLHQTLVPSGHKVRFTHYDPAKIDSPFTFQATTRKTRKKRTDFNLKPTASDDDSRAA